MKKFENFLFFYSIVVITILFISFGLTYPTPINFISGTLLLPIIFYFWIKLTSPESASAEKWSVRFLIVIVILSAMGIYTHILAGRMDTNYLNSLKSELTQAEKKNDELLKDNTKIQSQLDSKKPDTTLTKDSGSGTSITDLIYETPSPTSATQTHRITGKTGITTIDVHATPSLDSAKIGTLNANINYPYIEKQQDWYKIVLSGTTTGWVNVAQIKEL